MKKISTNALTEDQIPSANSSIAEINAFAITFDLSEIGDRIYEVHLENDFIGLSTIELRYILYCEQRRWNHFGRGYNNHAESRIRLLLKSLKEKLMRE